MYGERGSNSLLSMIVTSFVTIERPAYLCMEPKEWGMRAARVTVVVPYVCVCLFVVFCHHAHLDPEILVRTCSPRHGENF